MASAIDDESMILQPCVQVCAAERACEGWTGAHFGMHIAPVASTTSSHLVTDACLPCERTFHSECAYLKPEPSEMKQQRPDMSALQALVQFARDTDAGLVHYAIKCAFSFARMQCKSCHDL